MSADATRRVLIVDDEPESRLVMARLCEREGYAVDLVGSAEEAVEFLERRLPDAVIVDIVLPGDRSGYDVARRLKELPGGSSVPLIFVSVLHDTAARIDALRAGSDAYFEKPFEWDALVRKLRNLFEPSRADVGRVLIVDDDVDQIAFVQNVLADAGYVVEAVTDARDFAERALRFGPELLIIDVHMPGVSGYELARAVRQDGNSATMPIIFITAETSIEAEVASIAAGGDDHLRKPVDPRLLVSTVSARLGRARLLQVLVERDGLTGLLTRVAFDTHAAALMARKHRSRLRDAALVLVDLDEFKSVNDRFGHAVGDAVLRRAASLLQNGLRQSDVIGRYGGEEFVILLDETSVRDAVAVVEKLLGEFRSINFRDAAAPLHMTFSAGVAQVDPDESVAEWQKHADHALYAAKNGGRARVCTSGGPDVEPLDERIVASLGQLGARSGVDLVDELFRMFSTLAPERIHVVETSITEGSYDDAATAAHALRGASANIGAQRLSEMCGALERECKAGKNKQAVSLLADVREELVRVSAAMAERSIQRRAT